MCMLVQSLIQVSVEDEVNAGMNFLNYLLSLLIIITITMTNQIIVIGFIN